MEKARLAVDIGGTFTDLCLDWNGKLTSVKVLTTPRAPEEGVLTGVADILKLSGVKPADLGLIIHGTTLATNAIIERKGARTALVVTEGFRDSIEMAFEHRFEQYDIFMMKPPPLVARELRFGIPERLDGRGNVLMPLDEAAVRALAPKLKAAGNRGGGDRLHACLSRRQARAAHARHPGRDDARHFLFAVERGLARDPRVRALVDRRRQRLRPARDGPLSRPPRLRAEGAGLRLPAVHDDLGRRPRRASIPRASSRSGSSSPALPAARSWPRRWRASAASTRSCRSTWAAPPPRSA